MDDALGAFAAGLASTVVGMVFILAIGAVIGACWLIYEFCELVLPPLFECLSEGCELLGRRIAAWWRDVTWRRRVIRAHNEAIREIEATCRDQVALCEQLLDVEVDWKALTAGETAAVRSAVRVAVR